MVNLFPDNESIFNDLLEAVERNAAWGDQVIASRTLSSEKTVSRWFLTALFIQRWSKDYARLARAHLCTNPETKFEDTDIAKETLDQSNQLISWISSPEFDGYLSEFLNALSSHWGDQVDEQTEEMLFHRLVDTHEWCVTLAVISDVYDRERAKRSDDTPQLLPLAVNSVRKMCSQNSVLHELALNDTWERTQEFLRNYRNSEKSFSWMPYCQGVNKHGVKDPLFQKGINMMSSRDLGRTVAEQLSGAEGVSWDSVMTVIERICDAVYERGYKQFSKDLDSLVLGCSEGLFQNSVPINIIPGHGNGSASCAPLLIAVACRGSKANCTSVLRGVREHLLKCPATKGVLFVADEWHSNILAESLRDFSQHSKKGVKFSFVLAVEPGANLVHLPVEIY